MRGLKLVLIRIYINYMLIMKGLVRGYKSRKSLKRSNFNGAGAGLELTA